MAHIEVIAEYSDKGAMLWADAYPGAYARGETVSKALEKFPKNLSVFAQWAYGVPMPDLAESDFVVTHAYKTDLAVEDADGNVLFPSERLPMDMTEYTQKKQLCLRSAQDFEKLLNSIPQKDRALRKSRRTFYGKIPCSAREMADHTNRTLEYYASGLGIAFENEGGLFENRKRLFRAIESTPNFLLPRVHEAPDGELWTLRKLLRRLLWHDRIHAHALWRRAITFWQKDRIANPFFFTAEK
ncbi:MAG: hypothetical protein IJK12_03840 [Clostridia bacterium]|nr:hypothetical protein [Clostridia bacterium]MBR0436349.1 hypothetical protein [Clostridia bacterium]MBR3130499.1 hypothetical protein [Clostridia bacterium]